jgi:hypothetical protein
MYKERDLSLKYNDGDGVDLSAIPTIMCRAELEKLL